MPIFLMLNIVAVFSAGRHLDAKDIKLLEVTGRFAGADLLLAQSVSEEISLGGQTEI